MIHGYHIYQATRNRLDCFNFSSFLIEKKSFEQRWYHENHIKHYLWWRNYCCIFPVIYLIYSQIDMGRYITVTFTTNAVHGCLRLRSTFSACTPYLSNIVYMCGSQGNERMCNQRSIQTMILFLLKRKNNIIHVEHPGLDVFFSVFKENNDGSEEKWTSHPISNVGRIIQVHLIESTEKPWKIGIHSKSLSI